MKLDLQRRDKEVYNHRSLAEFFQSTDLAQLLELTSVGREFTWTNNSVGAEFKETRLDRAFTKNTNQHWIDYWPKARFEYFSGTSDHKGMIVAFSQVEKGKKPFRLFNSWLDD